MQALSKQDLLNRMPPAHLKKKSIDFLNVGSLIGTPGWVTSNTIEELARGCRVKSALYSFFKSPFGGFIQLVFGEFPWQSIKKL